MAIQSNFPSVRPSLLLDFASVKQLDSRITYTRASTASYYDGVTTSKAEQNLATYSQQFDNAAWLKENSSITADSTTAPDGNTTADSLVESSATGPHGTYTALLSVTTASTVTVSIYAKQNTKRYIVLGSTDGFANYPVLFDLQSGVIVGNATGYPVYSAPTSSTITSVGSSWYRLTVTVTINGAASSARIIAYLTDDSGSVSTGFSYTGNGTSSAYIWGAQLEQRSAVTAYTATTTQAITNYIPKLQSAASGVARFDNNPTTGESLGLLIEEQRTNIQTYSGSATGWTFNTNTTPNLANAQGIAPDGTNTAVCIPYGATGSLQSNLTVTSDTNTYTFSFYAKSLTGAGTVSTGTLGFPPPHAYFAGTIFNFSTLALGSGWSATAVGNGWYRLSRSFINTSQTTFINAVSTTTGVVLLWGPQLELGSFATSYIPTVASQVTRAADAASMTGTNFSSWYNQAQGTFYIDQVSSTGRQGVFNTSNVNQNTISTINQSTSDVALVNTNGTGVTITINDSSASRKTALGYKFNDFNFAFNGAIGTTNTSVVIPVVDYLQIGNRGNANDNNINGTIKKIAYYPLRVTNAQLQALTS